MYCDIDWVNRILPLVLPENWKVLSEGVDGAVFVRRDGLQVIVSGRTEKDGHRWLHVSAANMAQERMPTYQELCEVKDLFIGRQAKAVQVFPPEAEKVNINPYCLHLWHNADVDPLPDFTGGGKSL